MPEKEFWEEATEAAKAIRQSIENKEITRQRDLLPKAHQGDPKYATKMENRSLNLGDEDKAWLDWVRTGIESKALSSDEEGRRLISPVIAKELEREVESLVIIRQLAGHRTLEGSDHLEVRGMDEAEVGWGDLALGTDITEKTLHPSVSRDIFAEDLFGLSKISENMLADSDHDLAAYIISSFSRVVADAEELAFLKGTGHANHMPQGIATDTTLLANAKPTAAHSVVTIEDFMQCIYEVPARYRKGSVWLVNSLTEFELRKLRWLTGETYEGGYVWQPSVQAGVPPTFLGYPIHCVDNLDTLSDAAKPIAVFGNLGVGYVVLDRQSIAIVRLDQLYLESSLIGFRLHRRVGGYLPKPSNKYLCLLTEAAE